MLKPTTRLSSILVQVYALFFIGIIFFFAHCSARPEEDEVENKKHDLENENRGKDEQGKFKTYIGNTIHLQETASDANDVIAHIELAIDIINKNPESLNKDPKSTDNALYILLEAIATVTGGEGLGAQNGTRMEGYIKIFKLLREKRFELDGTLLEKLRKNATEFKSESETKQSLYYPLVVLGGMGPDVHVLYRDLYRKEDSVPIIVWAILSDLHKDLKKEVLEVLTNSNTKNASNYNFSLSTAQGDKMTPAMFAASKASSATDDEAAAYWREIFRLFLKDSQHIKFMDTKEKSEIKGEPAKLKDQPLLSFIIYNCVCTEVRQHDKWLDILDEALETGDLKEKTKQNKIMITHYIRDYINKTGPSTEKHFVDNKVLYDEDALNKVRDRLNEYIK